MFLKKIRVFPHSLRQLVLLAFFLVLLPLLFLASQAYQSLESLSTKAAEINALTWVDSRRSEAMINISLSMERSYRQYCVVVEPALGSLYQSQREQYTKMLNEHAVTVRNEALINQLHKLLEEMSELHCDSYQPALDTEDVLQEFSRSSTELDQFTRGIILSRSEEVQKSIARRGEFLGRESLLLFLVSLVLVALFTKMIIGPVNQVKEMINCLGAGVSLENQLEFKGPKEIQALAQRIEWLSDRLKWLESQRHEFLRHLSHELKTPLASMREGTELLADQILGSLSKDQLEVVSILDKSSRHLQELIEQLLDYNRKISQVVIDKKTIELNDVVDEIMKLHHLSARSKSIEVKVELDVEQCWAVKELLLRVMDNIYSNAVHYGKESATIWVKSYEQGACTYIDIANTGDAIPNKEQPMLFEPFYQGGRQRKSGVKGTGLGLSIARDCIQKMQGELSLAVVDYADVCFRIKLPAFTTIKKETN